MHQRPCTFAWSPVGDLQTEQVRLPVNSQVSMLQSSVYRKPRRQPYHTHVCEHCTPTLQMCCPMLSTSRLLMHLGSLLHMNLMLAPSI